jgi:hypothetical protein
MATSARDKAAPRRPDVFISYSRKDREFVKRLEAALQARGREAWVDWEGIRPAEEFMQAIFPAIEGTDTFVFVISPDSVTSEICGRELAHAASHNKRMVPIFAREVDVKAIPEALAKLNWVFFCRENENFDVGTDTLISAIDTDLDWVHAHTRLLTRAIEWEAKGKSNSFVLRGEDLRAAEQWLAHAGAEKERQPTALQTEYIIASRKAAARRQRITLGAVTFGLILAIVLAIVAWRQRTEAVKNANEADRQKREAVNQETKAKNTSVQADFDVALLYRQKSDTVDPRALAHLARALRTSGSARLPRQYLVSLLRDTDWHLPETQMRFEKGVWVAGFSADGRKIVTASDDKTARVWDAESGKPVGEPMRHERAIKSASFSADGRRIVTVSDEKTARVWDAESGKPVGEPLRHERAINSASFSPDGRRILTASDDGTAQVWDAESGKPLSKPMRHEDGLFVASFNADGQRILTASSKGTARVWDTQSGEPVGEPIRHEHINAASFSADGRRVVTASDDHTAQV